MKRMIWEEEAEERWRVNSWSRELDVDGAIFRGYASFAEAFGRNKTTPILGSIYVLTIERHFCDLIIISERERGERERERESEKEKEREKRRCLHTPLRTKKRVIP